MACAVIREELSRYAAGDLAVQRARELEQHTASCDACRRRLDALARLDAALSAAPRCEPPAQALLRVRRALSRELRGSGAPELMTLEEVARFLRVDLDALEEVVLDLPCFELAGQLRVRRSKLLEWVESRERAWAASSAQSEAARSLAGAP